MQFSSRLTLIPLALALGFALTGPAEAASYQLTYKVPGFEKRQPTSAPFPQGDCTTIEAAGGTVSHVSLQGVTYRLHAFTALGADSFTVNCAPPGATIDVLVVGGGGGSGTAAGGAGWYGDGADGSHPAEGGASFLHGGLGGASDSNYGHPEGGFGGGGAGSPTNGYGGGGGGYSGGGGGSWDPASEAPAMAVAL